MELKQALEGDDVDEIQREDGRAPGGVAEAGRGGLRAGQRAGAASGAAGNGDAGRRDDEVVEEADYEVIDEEDGDQAVTRRSRRTDRRARGGSGLEA